MRPQRIPENTTFDREVTFIDANGDKRAPVSARYRVDCLTTDVVVRDWTSIDPAVVVTLTFNQVDNEIQGYQDWEKKQCVVEATDINGNTLVNDFTWIVRNLQGVGQ